MNIGGYGARRSPRCDCQITRLALSEADRPLVLDRVEPTVNTLRIGVIRGSLCLLAGVDRGVWMSLSLVFLPRCCLAHGVTPRSGPVAGAGVHDEFGYPAAPPATVPSGPWSVPVQLGKRVRRPLCGRSPEDLRHLEGAAA